MRLKRRLDFEAVAQQLDDMLLAACDRENETSGGAEQLMVNNLIGTTEAAELLECTPQRVRQVVPDLDGQRCACGSGWVFERQTVLDYYARERRTR